MNEDWLKISLKFSMYSLWETDTAVENIMELLLEQIGNLLKVTHRNASRIWTLHKIVGNEVHFSSSKEPQRSEHQDKIRHISKGLIGKLSIRAGSQKLVGIKTKNKGTRENSFRKKFKPERESSPQL